MEGHWSQAFRSVFEGSQEVLSPARGRGRNRPGHRLAAQKETRDPQGLSPSNSHALSGELPAGHLVLTPCRSSTSGSTGSTDSPATASGANRVPSGDFDDPQVISESGWVDMSYQLDGLVGKVSVVARAEPPPKTKAEKAKRPIRELDGANSGRVIKLEVKVEQPEDLDKVQPFLDFPVAAIRSPPIRVERNNLVRISVLTKRLFPTASGAGGVIIRDSIGGEQFQYRTTAPIPEFSARVLLFRKAPADGTFTVTLGLAGYGEAFFDDLRVEVIEQDDGRAAPDVARRNEPAQTMRAPRAPDPSPPAAAARSRDSGRQPR